MDPVTIGAVLLAVITGTSEALGGQLWAGVVSLVRRPLRRKSAAGSDVAVVSGEAELKALQHAPDNQKKAVVLAENCWPGRPPTRSLIRPSKAGGNRPSRSGPVSGRWSPIPSAEAPSMGRCCKARTSAA